MVVLLTRYSHNYAEFVAATAAPVDLLARMFNVGKSRMRITLAQGGVPMPPYAGEFLR